MIEKELYLHTKKTMLELDILNNSLSEKLALLHVLLEPEEQEMLGNIVDGFQDKAELYISLITKSNELMKNKGLF